MIFFPWAAIKQKPPVPPPPQQHEHFDSAIRGIGVLYGWFLLIIFVVCILMVVI